MSRDDDDVIDRCADDSSPSRPFYSLMTSSDDDDVIDDWKPEPARCSMESECLFNTRMSCDRLSTAGTVGVDVEGRLPGRLGYMLQVDRRDG